MTKPILAGLLMVALWVAPALAATHLTVDPTAIARLPQFASADKQIATRWRTMDLNLRKDIRSHHLSSRQVQLRLKAIQAKIDTMRVSLLGPLNQQVVNAIGFVAHQKHADAVLDKRVVLTGLTDVTPEVLARLKAHDKNGPVAPPSDTTIGFVDQSRIRNLQAFRTVEAQMVSYYSKELSHGKKLSPQVMQSLQEKRLSLYSPLESKVHDAIHSTAKREGVSLILDHQDVLWGGKDLTAPVVSSAFHTHS